VALIDRTEFESRLEEFASDTDGRKGLMLPGWDRYRELAGGDATARALFVEIQRQEGPIMAAVFGVSTQSASELFEQRLIQLVQRQTIGDLRNTGPPVGSAAAMLFLSAMPELGSSPRAAWVEQLVQRPPLRESIQAGTYRDAVRRLLVGWVFNAPDGNEALLMRRLNLASIYELKEALPFAFPVALGEGKYASAQPLTRATALLLIGNLGWAEHVDRLEPLLQDASVCVTMDGGGPGQPRRNVQIRDVAMVVMAGLTDQRPADYGYVHARIQLQRLYQLQTLHLENDAQRAGAIAKWRAWRSEQAKARNN
jgi:hypothetical protein